MLIGVGHSSLDVHLCLVVLYSTLYALHQCTAARSLCVGRRPQEIALCRRLLQKPDLRACGLYIPPLHCHGWD